MHQQDATKELELYDVVRLLRPLIGTLQVYPVGHAGVIVEVTAEGFTVEMMTTETDERLPCVAEDVEIDPDVIIIEYEDMTDAQQTIVDMAASSHVIPPDLSDDELRDYIFGKIGKGAE